MVSSFSVFFSGIFSRDFLYTPASAGTNIFERHLPRSLVDALHADGGIYHLVGHACVCV